MNSALWMWYEPVDWYTNLACAVYESEIYRLRKLSSYENTTLDYWRKVMKLGIAAQQAYEWKHNVKWMPKEHAELQARVILKSVGL